MESEWTTNSVSLQWLSRWEFSAAPQPHPILFAQVLSTPTHWLTNLKVPGIPQQVRVAISPGSGAWTIFLFPASNLGAFPYGTPVSPP